MTWQHGYRWAIHDVLQVHILSQHGVGWGLPLSAGSLPSFYFPIKTKHPINLIHLSILLEGRRLEVCLVEKKKKNYHCWWTQMGSQKLMTVTVTADYRLHLPWRTSPWMASLPAQSVCFPLAHRKEVSREEWRLLAGWDGPGPRLDLCVVDVHRKAQNLPLTYRWRRAGSPMWLSSLTFCASLSTLPHHDLTARVFSSFCIFFLLLLSF